MPYSLAELCATPFQLGTPPNAINLAPLTPKNVANAEAQAKAEFSSACALAARMLPVESWPQVVIEAQDAADRFIYYGSVRFMSWCDSLPGAIQTIVYSLANGQHPQEPKITAENVYDMVKASGVTVALLREASRKLWGITITKSASQKKSESQSGSIGPSSTNTSGTSIPAGPSTISTDSPLPNASSPPDTAAAPPTI